MSILIRSNWLSLSLSMIFLIVGPNILHAKADKVRTYNDGQGWKLQVNGEDFFIKGIVWGYTPPNENFTYNLWGQPDRDIMAVLDHDFSLMKEAGVNAVRSFSIMPPKWVRYLNDKYQIKTVINPLMGRYGVRVGKKWYSVPDYSDPATRETIKKNTLEIIEKYRDVPGVLMFALGNESNYGLSWSSFEIENLPVEEQQTARAEFLYSLFAETIKEGKKIAPNHPFTIVNGDIQYIDLIAKYGSDWDLLGVNAYRGQTFTALWKDVSQKLGIPVAFFEFGSDAFNARDLKEDQASQAFYLQQQMQDIYNNTYNKGYGNAIGGFVFEFRDEWWKYRQTENLDVHDKTASWENGGYKFDHVKGKNNMNEEWFGIARLGDLNSEGVFVAEPRMAYDVLGKIFAFNPYEGAVSNVKRSFDSIDLEVVSRKVAKRDKDNDWGEKSGFNFTGGKVTYEGIVKGYDTFNPNPNENSKHVTDFGLSTFLDFDYNKDNFRAKVGVNAIAKAANSDFEFRYVDRVVDNSEKRVEIYDFEASYIGSRADINLFYHTPRYHWGNEGDFFGLVREATDMEGMDIWNARAPFGLEYIGKKNLDGLKVLVGPEIYWGANPKAVVKYQFGEGKKYTFMHSEEYDERGSGTSSATDVTLDKTSQTTLYGKFQLRNGAKLELGGIISGTEHVDDTFNYIKNGLTYSARVRDEDTLGFKGKYSFKPRDNQEAYVGFNYAGLVARGGQSFPEWGTMLPYSEWGNKKEVEAGVRITNGYHTVFPRVLYRENIINANPLVLPSITGISLTRGITPRNLRDDPFAVLNNRAARAAEIFFTYDPTPATYFYQWDNDLRENAKIAYNVGLTYIDYSNFADAELYYDKSRNTNFAFPTGQFAENVWLLKSRIVANPDKMKRWIFNIERGVQQATGVPAPAVEYTQLETKFVYNKRDIYSFRVAKNKWGPFDFQRQFNTTYPQQWKLEFTRLLDRGLSEKDSSKYGIKFLFRTLDNGSPGEYTRAATGEFNNSMFEVQAYYTHRF